MSDDDDENDDESQQRRITLTRQLLLKEKLDSAAVEQEGEMYKAKKCRMGRCDTE